MFTDDFIPAEWSAQKALWVAWPSHTELWPGQLLHQARIEIACMINAVAAHQPVHIMACGDEARHSADAMLHGRIDIADARFGDIWLRDTGPVFTACGKALRFLHNGWGGKYLYAHDDEIGDTIADLAHAQIIHHPFVLEGGALDHNGQGSILTTRQCLLNPNRNNWSEAEAEQALQQAFNARRIIWLDDGLLKDHTDGHIDNLARFVGENTVVCQHGSGNDDPNTLLYDQTFNALQAAGLDVIQIPSPGLVHDANGDVMPASHMNFVISNDVVVVPVYDAANGDKAVEAIAALFPDRETIGISSRALLTGGGSFHCISQQEPAYG